MFSTIPCKLYGIESARPRSLITQSDGTYPAITLYLLYQGLVLSQWCLTNLSFPTLGAGCSANNYISQGVTFRSIGPPSPRGEALPYMGYIGMCRCEGYGFQVVYSRIGYINQSFWV